MSDDEGEEKISDLHWDELTEAVEVEAGQRGESATLSRSRRQAASGERRALGHLWLVSYSDFMTIMMIFFLGLYGYTALAKAKLLRSRPVKMTISEFAQSIGQLKKSLGDEIQVREDASRVTVQLAERVLFASGRSDLTKNAITSLDLIGRSLKDTDGEIVVEGHTDNVPIRGGKYKSNWELSVTRSFHVIEALSAAGVSPDRMAAWGFGENRPLATNATDEGRSQNRRIEIVLINKKGES